LPTVAVSARATRYTSAKASRPASYTSIARLHIVDERGSAIPATAVLRMSAGEFTIEFFEDDDRRSPVEEWMDSDPTDVELATVLCGLKHVLRHRGVDVCQTMSQAARGRGSSSSASAIARFGPLIRLKGAYRLGPGTPQQIPLPTDYLSAVSCPMVGTCVAVGEVPTSGNGPATRKRHWSRVSKEVGGDWFEARAAMPMTR